MKIFDDFWGKDNEKLENNVYLCSIFALKRMLMQKRMGGDTYM